MHTINDKSIATYVAYADTGSLQRVAVKGAEIYLLLRELKFR